MRAPYNTTSEVTRDMDKGTTYLSQTHYAKEFLRTYNFWNATPRLTPMQPNKRLNKWIVTRPLPRISIDATTALLEASDILLE